MKVEHPHELPQQGGRHVIGKDGKLQRVEWTLQPGEQPPAPAAPTESPAPNSEPPRRPARPSGRNQE